MLRPVLMNRLDLNALFIGIISKDNELIRIFQTRRASAMKINVDMQKCQHYGQCVFEAPAIFKLNDQDKLEYIAEADESQRENVEAAIDVCPMQAIFIVE
jgi:ferredoxin